MNRGHELYFADTCSRVFNSEKIPPGEQEQLYKIARTWLFEDTSHDESATAVARAFQLGWNSQKTINFPQTDRSKPKETPMIIRVWLHLEDGGDGSAVPQPYPTKKLAEKAAEQEMKEFGQALCDNVVSLDLRVNKYENLPF